MKVLIIEDEQRTALDLANVLSSVDPDISITRIIDSVEESIQYLGGKEIPDLIFMDIQLADGQSFEIFEAVEVKAPVVFCTAFDEYALQAFQVNSIDYVLKPFNRDSIVQALQKVRNMRQLFQKEGPNFDNLANLLKSMKTGYKTSFLVGHRDKLLPIPVSDIAYFYIEHEITFLQTFDGRRHVINMPLDELEKTMDPSIFYRANRQFLINFKSVSAVEQYFARKLLLKLNTNTREPVIVKQSKATDFLHWMEHR
ncbi:MAG: response regulator transcription factor [Lewinellaceae bacterium]|nr:response regulator transcription factor [Lewinellaceae bacterium]